MATIALKHADGTAVTAQEAYDAFMNTRVLIVDRKETTHEAIQMVWYDTNSTQVNPAAVGFVRFKYVSEGADGTVSLVGVVAGDSSLVPTQPG